MVFAGTPLTLLDAALRGTVLALMLLLAALLLRERLRLPASDAEGPVKRGLFNLQHAPQGTPVPGNGRLVDISQGSGDAPWVHADLARRLVQSGFVVAARAPG